MSERQRDGYVVKGELSHTEDLNKNYISQIIDYVEFIIKHVPFLVEGEELRGEYQESYGEVLGLFQQIEEEYNGLSDCIEIDFDIEEVKESLTSIFNGAYEKFIRENLSVVFPEKLAEVNIPEFCQAEEYAIPDVRRWQHANKISPELADREYMRFIAEAREAVTDSLTEDGTFDLPDDFIITRPEYIPGNDGKMKLSSLLEDFERRKLKEVEDEECKGINPKGDLKFANSVLKLIKSIKLPSEEELAKQYKKATIKENSPVVRSLAESMAKEHMSGVLDNALRVLSEKLNSYEVAPAIVGESLRKATKRKRSNKPKPTIENGDSQPVKIGLKAGDAVTLDGETFPWLKEDSIVDVLHVEQGNDSTVVAIIDARTEEAKKVEHKMTGYENDEKKRDVLPIIKDKLTMAAKCVATSEDKSVGLPIGLNNRLKELYPFIIYAWKDQTHNAKRVYVSKVSIEDMPDESETKKSLQEAGVTEIVLLLGACDKQNQESLVALFIDGDSRDAAKYGAGA